MRFILPFILLFPVIEIVLLIKVGQQVGVLSTLGLLLLMGILGSVLLRLQGISTLWRIQERLMQGELTAEEILGGVIIAIGAVLLIIPGFFSDALALLCFFPLSRYWVVKRWLKNAAFMSAVNGKAEFYQASSRAGFGDEPIEGEWSRADNKRLDEK